MTPLALAAVALGGMVGAPARYLTDWLLNRRQAVLPRETLLVNVAGSLVLGLLTGLGQHGHVPAAVDAGFGTGFCGAFTTFSAFSVEVVRLVQDGETMQAVRYVGASLVLGLAAAAAGVALGLAL